MAKSNLLIEIGSEELPPKNLKKLQNDFVEHFTKSLKTAALAFEHAEGFITPRRLAILVTGISLQQPVQNITKRGPAKNAAFDASGKPTKAALGFAESCGVSIDQISLQETDKGAWIVFEKTESGKTAEALIPELLTEVLNTLPIGRRMRWGARSDSFLRPIQWVVILLDNKVIPAELFGVKSSNVTFGHRFHHPEALTITYPQEYESLLLNKGHVIANFEKRREKILAEMTEFSQDKKFHAIIENDLLDEVTGLVEWPVVLLGSFDKTYLEIPREALITSMQTHQRCFPIEDQNKKLLPNFLLVSNISSKNPAAVINGNECVIAARLADAVFYYRVDKEIPLKNRLQDLKLVRFQWGLGTLWDKSQRIAKLAMHIAPKVHADPIYTERAGLLCKTDLLTQMVGEFPELQGIMGRYYALHDSEPAPVAIAIKDHYHPRFAQDTLPTTPEGSALALADRLDSLVGIFGMGNRPTGDKDPFGLRRQALGVLRILVENHHDLDLKDLLIAVRDQYSHQEIVLKEKDVVQHVLDFCFERFRALYQDQEINPRVFEAVFAKRPTKPFDFDRRIEAVSVFIKLKEAESLAAANKRVHNILSKCDQDVLKDTAVHDHLLIESAEKNLWLQLCNKEKEIIPLLKIGDYTDALKSLASLREPIDLFFVDVMVMVDDLPLRNNRLKLLNRLRTLFLEIADISLL